MCTHTHTHTHTRPPKQQAASPGLNKHLLSEWRHARGHCGWAPSFPGPLNPPFPGLFTTFSPGKFHLDQLWQPGLCRMHWPTDAFSVVPCALTIVCVVNSYKLGDFIHTHKSPVIWENQRPGEVSWCFYNPAVEPAEQRLSLGTGWGVTLSHRASALRPTGLHQSPAWCRQAFEFAAPDFHVTSSSRKTVVNPYSSELCLFFFLPSERRFVYTGQPRRYRCIFVSRPLHKESHTFFGFPVPIKVMFIRDCSLLSVQ